MRLQLSNGCASDAVSKVEETAGNFGEQGPSRQGGRKRGRAENGSQIGVRGVKGIRRGKGLKS